MRPYIFIILLSLFHQAAGQTRFDIQKHHINRIDQTFTVQGNSELTSTFYDTLGRTIKQIDKSSYDGSKFVMINKYLNDTLLSEITVDTFYNNKFFGRTTVSFSYTFDHHNRVTSKLSESSTGEMVKEIYSFKADGRLDTLFVFNNDTTLWSGNSFTGVRQLKNSLTLKRIKVYSYNGDTAFVKDCCYPVSEYDKLCCKGFVEVLNDSLEVSIETSWGLNGCILDSSARVSTYTTRKNESGDYYSENPWGDKTYYTNYRNDKGLLLKRINKRINSEGKSSTSITKWKYYYRQNVRTHNKVLPKAGLK